MRALSEHSRAVLPVTSAVTFFGFLDTHLLIPVIALYASGLEAGVGLIGLIVGLYSIVNTPANLVFGRLIDRVGYKAPLIGGLAGSVVSMILYTITRSPFHLALVRAVHGAAGALVAPSTMSAMAHHSTAGRRGRAMSYYGIALASAALIGYPVSGLIASRLGFTALFLLGASAVGLGMLLALLLPRARGGTRRAQARDVRWTQVRGLLVRKGLLVSYAAIFAQYFTFGGVVTLLPVHVERLGMGAFEIGMLLAAFSALFVVTQFLGGALSDRAGRLPPIVGGLLCVILALTVLPSLSGFWPMAAAMALYGTGYGLIFPSISALITDNTVVEERGLATGLFHALLTAGVAIGAPLMGWVGGVIGTAAGLLITPAPVLLTLALALLSLRDR